jgi:site-specific recombinase XerD
MNARIPPPPKPIFDNLEAIGDQRRRQALEQNVPIDGSVDDYLVSIRFLLSYDGSKATFNAYRREIERLLQWTWHVSRKSVEALSRDEIVEFVKFLQKPPTSWIGTKNVARFINHEGQRLPNAVWRPFVQTVAKAERRRGVKPDVSKYRPSPASTKATFAVLSSFFDYLVQESYVAVNPVALIRQKSKFLRREQNLAPVRRLSELQWDYVLETAELMADAEPNEHERTLFVMTALFTMYLRVSELVANERSEPVMGDFKRDRDGSWWLHVIGKGNKLRTVTVSNAMLKALKRYRGSRGLSPLPTPNESESLVAKTRGNGPIKSTRQIRHIVQECFDQAYERMRADGLEEDALDLKESTVHWLRHTGISEDVRSRPQQHVRDDAGHGSMVTTSRYIESDERERHASGRDKPARFFEDN